MDISNIVFAVIVIVALPILMIRSYRAEQAEKRLARRKVMWYLRVQVVKDDLWYHQKIKEPDFTNKGFILPTGSKWDLEIVREEMGPCVYLKGTWIGVSADQFPGHVAGYKNGDNLKLLRGSLDDALSDSEE